MPTPTDEIGTDGGNEGALSRALTVIAAVVAPTTLLTGLRFYFGRIYASDTFAYFGVVFTALDLTVSDYLTRSADALVVPLLGAVDDDVGPQRQPRLGAGGALLAQPVLQAPGAFQPNALGRSSTLDSPVIPYPANPQVPSSSRTASDAAGA